jgi:predicted DNA-binding transcriptional regulator YafY
MSHSPYSRTRNKQLVRVLRLMALLQNGRLDLNALSAELSVSTRTIRRDIEAIEAAHLPIQKACGEDGIARWSITQWRAA